MFAQIKQCIFYAACGDACLHAWKHSHEKNWQALKESKDLHPRILSYIAAIETEKPEWFALDKITLLFQRTLSDLGGQRLMPLIARETWKDEKMKQLIDALSHALTIQEQWCHLFETPCSTVLRSMAHPDPKAPPEAIVSWINNLSFDNWYALFDSISLYSPATLWPLLFRHAPASSMALLQDMQVLCQIKDLDTRIEVLLQLAPRWLQFDRDTIPQIAEQMAGQSLFTCPSLIELSQTFDFKWSRDDTLCVLRGRLLVDRISRLGSATLEEAEKRAVLSLLCGGKIRAEDCGKAVILASENNNDYLVAILLTHGPNVPLEDLVRALNLAAQMGYKVVAKRLSTPMCRRDPLSELKCWTTRLASEHLQEAAAIAREKGYPEISDLLLLKLPQQQQPPPRYRGWFG